MPLATRASAAPRMSFSLTAQPKRFQLFQPMGGVGASPSAAEARAGTRKASERIRLAGASVRMGLSVAPIDGESIEARGPTRSGKQRATKRRRARSSFPGLHDAAEIADGDGLAEVVAHPRLEAARAIALHG